MAVELTGLLVLNAAYFAVGVSALAAAGWLTPGRLGVAYPLGLVLVAAPASYLALLHVPVGAGALAAGVVVVGLGLWRARAWRWRPQLPRVRVARGVEPLVALLLALLTAVVLLYAARTFAVRPLLERDAWAIWMAKARLLYAAPSAAPAALRTGDYGQAPYPLALPTIEALGFGGMGRFDGTVIGVQFWLLAASFPLALWTLLRRHARSWLVVLVALTIVAAPQIVFQLMTKYADVPLALFVGLGLAAGAAWLVAGEPWLLGCFAAFLGIAGITKSEGFLFALAGIVAFAVAARFRRPALLASAGVLVIMLPWRLYCSAYGLTTADYSLSNAVNPSYLHAHDDRVGPIARELGRQLSKGESWGLLTWVILLALVCAAFAARWRLLAFAGGWLLLAGGGLFLTYWISVLPTESHLTNSSYRTIVSLLVGGASVVPLLVLPRDE